MTGEIAKPDPVFPPTRNAGRNPTSVFELFKVGIGPSSSHTVGPMIAASNFVSNCEPRLKDISRIRATAFGSLAWTGRGHGTDRAILLGLAGYRPEIINPDHAGLLAAEITTSKRLRLTRSHVISFDPEADLIFDTTRVFERHPNALQFEALRENGAPIINEIWYSIGGGFVVRDGDEDNGDTPTRICPHSYATAAELLSLANQAGMRIPDVVLTNEAVRASVEQIHDALDQIVDAMFSCIDQGLSKSGELPGPLRVKRRARSIFQSLVAEEGTNLHAPHRFADYVSAYAIAVNEENAAGGRVVTAPTNGAAGVVPAVLRYYRDFCPGATRDGMRAFLLAAAAIGGIIKANASISGAEVGCQGEVGSAAAMAAAGLAAALKGTNEQIENAAEIAMEHHLGMTCDPIGGLVQIPCIERNAFGANKAINAASLALRGDGRHVVSLDQVIETMRQTGRDMESKYKETSRGGLAVNVPEC